MSEKNSRFPIVFDKCPSCGCEETLTKLAWDEEVDEDSKQIPVGHRNVVVQLVDPRRGPKLMMPMLVMNFDICANPECGLERCVAAMKVRAPVSGRMPGGQMPGGMPPFPGMNTQGN